MQLDKSYSNIILIQTLNGQNIFLNVKTCYLSFIISNSINMPTGKNIWDVETNKNSLEKKVNDVYDLE